jgi:Tol biopolymer transport system component
MRYPTRTGSLVMAFFATLAVACGESGGGLAGAGGMAGQGGAAGVGGMGGGAGGIAGVPGAYALAYLAEQERPDFQDLYVGRTNGTDNYRVNHELDAERGRVLAFAWSPDGTRVAYLADDNPFIGPACPTCSQELFTSQPDGSDNRRVNGALVENGRVESFSWSPDGSRIAYLATQDTDDIPELYTDTATGADNQKINGVLSVGDSVGEYHWSPDGSRLAYLVHRAGDDVREVYSNAAEGGDEQRVNPALPANRQVRSFLWSPAGTRIAYTADQDTAGLFELFTSAPDGSENAKVNGELQPGSFGLRFSRYEWNSDGSLLAYQADETQIGAEELFTAAPDGSERNKVNPELPGGASLSGFAWSPDGLRIAYVADQDTLSVRELYVSAPDGTANQKINTKLPEGGFGFVSGFRWSPDGGRRSVGALHQSP